jgi:hypothetical protein
MERNYVSRYYAKMWEQQEAKEPTELTQDRLEDTNVGAGS